jgi:dynein heavy chain
MHFVMETCLRKPLFSLELVFRNGKVMYNVDPKVFEAALVSVLEKGLLAAEGLPELEPAIMDKIFWASKPLLDSVHPQEPVVIQLIAKLRKVFRESLPPLEMYLRHYDKHIKLLNLDITQYAAMYEEENKTIEEMEQDIINHTHSWESLERDIPSHINIGLFYLGCESIRSAMRKDLSKIVLDIIAKKTSKMAASIIQVFAGISNRLKEKPTKIEEQMELREYLKTIPEMIKLQQLKIQEMSKNYDVLDKYRYECSNEDVRSKWAVYSLPQKTDDQLKAIEANLESDELVFKNRLFADQEVF